MMKKIKKLIVSLITLSFLVSAGVAFAQTPTTTDTGAVTPVTTATPGTPNTGAGGDASVNLLMLAVSGIVLIGGVAYLATTRRSRTE